MSTRTTILVFTLTLPLSGCATLGLYERALQGSDEAIVNVVQEPAVNEQASETFTEWLVRNEDRVRELCASPAGSDAHVYALDHMRFAVSRDPERFSEALLNGYRVAKCPSDGQSIADANPPAVTQPDADAAELIEAERMEAERLEEVGKWVDRGFSWLFDLATALYLYGMFNDGEFF